MGNLRGSTPASESHRGVLDCLKVTTSAESKLLGVPVALLGLLFFLGMAVVCLPAMWRNRSTLLPLARLGASLAGVAMVVYLIYVELFVLDSICLWCTAAHGIALALFSAIVVAMAAAGVPETSASGSAD